VGVVALVLGSARVFDSSWTLGSVIWKGKALRAGKLTSQGLQAIKQVFFRVVRVLPTVATVCCGVFLPPVFFNTCLSISFVAFMEKVVGSKKTTEAV